MNKEAPKSRNEYCWYLDICGQGLTEFPYLPNSLRHLHAANNELSFVPDTLPDGISLLDVSNNKLTSLPDKLPKNLRVLDVSQNNISRLPDTLPGLLIGLYVSDTPFEKIWLSTKLIPLLTCTGIKVQYLVNSACWLKHTWHSCPINEIFGATDIEHVPEEWKLDAMIFVDLFDRGRIKITDNMKDR